MIGHTTHVLEKIEDFEDFYTLLFSDEEPEPEGEQDDQKENPTKKEI